MASRTASLDFVNAWGKASLECWLRYETGSIISLVMENQTKDGGNHGSGKASTAD